MLRSLLELPRARPLEPAHGTGLNTRAVAGATIGAMTRFAASKPAYLFWSCRFTYAVGGPTLYVLVVGSI